MNTKVSRQYEPVEHYQCHFWQVSLAYALWLHGQTGRRYRVFKHGICWAIAPLKED